MQKSCPSNEGARVYGGDAVRLKVMCLGYFSISKFVACENKAGKGASFLVSCH